MKAGLVGEKLSHSLSPEIHVKFYRFTGTEGSYSLFETSKDSLGELLARLMNEGYSGLNVTIPYKTEVMKHLDSLSDEAAAIGAVNTICFSDGKRRGENTDYYGLKELIVSSGIGVKGTRAVILGTGGAARCALKLLNDMGAAEVITASRNPEKADSVFSAVSYADLDSLTAIGLLVNTTPSGMYPGVSSCPVPEMIIERCEAVIDIVYNPPETRLLTIAREKGIKAVNGLKMLCAQAVKSQEIWNGKNFGKEVYNAVYSFMRREFEKANIVLTGMPGSGKTTIGMLLAEKLGMGFADTDAMVEEKYGKIPEIFRSQGEAAFREYEHKAAVTASCMKDTVISTGGGMVLSARNINALKASGIIVYINRPLEKLLSETDISGRPLLLGGSAAIERLYKERRLLYESCADIESENSGTAEECAAAILTILG